MPGVDPIKVAPMARNASLDHIRIVLTTLVILHHTAIVYGGSGGWYWREEPDSSTLPLLLFNAVNQSFFMGFFFLLAGYFTPGSVERKGAARYLGERLRRLGIPLLGYFFLISPATVALARMADGHAFWPGWWAMTRQGEFRPGPLWFVEALLIFALVYVGWRRFRKPAKTTHDDGDVAAEGAGIRTGMLLFAATAVALVSFAVRLAVPVGSEVLWLQLGYFPGYVLLFTVGCRAARSRALERVSAREAIPWGVVSLLAVVLLPVMIGTRSAHGSFLGGWTLNALIYATWNPLAGWGIILLMLWGFRRWFSTGTVATAWLSRHAYGSYIIHPPVVVGISLLARSWPLPAWVKFGLVGGLACVGSAVAAAGLMRLPGARRVL